MPILDRLESEVWTCSALIEERGGWRARVRLLWRAHVSVCDYKFGCGGLEAIER